MEVEAKNKNKLFPTKFNRPFPLVFNKYNSLNKEEKLRQTVFQHSYLQHYHNHEMSMATPISSPLVQLLNTAVTRVK